MDVSALLKGVNTLDNYMGVTQDLLSSKYTNEKIHFNMSLSTIISLKKVQSLEIEYFNKCEVNGAAILLFEKMLLSPPSRIWSMLGKDLVALVHGWLEDVGQRLISRQPRWWPFMQQLLKLLQNLTKKGSQINNILTEVASRSFLDLATRGHLTVTQRQEVLHTLNVFCADSSKEIRYSLRTQFDPFFVRLSSIMASCGHLPTQYSITETLLRWLLPRDDPLARREAAAKWFPEHLYTGRVVELFLERPWLNFGLDARDFLNAHNESSGLVTSVECRRLCVGEHVLLSGAEKRPTWLDINMGTRCVSLLLHPRVLGPLGVAAHNSCEVLTVTSDITLAANMYRESASVPAVVVLQTLEPPPVYPAGRGVFGAGGRRVNLGLGPGGDLLRVDHALRTVFRDKYQVSLDLENVTPLSPDFVKKSVDKGDDVPPRVPINVELRKRSGYVLRSVGAVTFKSPSTTSSTSLAQLPVKLASLQHVLPRLEKALPVSITPALSRVTELSEISENRRNSSDTDSTLKLRPGGVCVFTGSQSKKSFSDGDVAKEKARNTISQEKPEEIYSLLHMATFGSTDQSVINDTLERMSKNIANTTDNITQLSGKEPLESIYGDGDHLLDSCINTENGKKSQDLVEIIEDTPNAEPKQIVPFVRLNRSPNDKCTVISKSTSDDSNTEAINEPVISFVTVRKRNQCKKPVRSNNDTVTIDVQTVEDFFTQHCTENKADDLIISPTLAKKLNATSTESSEDFDRCLISNKNDNLDVENNELLDIEVVECLNHLIDQVCNNFEVFTEYLNREDKGLHTMYNNKNRNDDGDFKNNIPGQDNGNTKPQTKTRKVNKKGNSRNIRSKSKAVKLTFREVIAPEATQPNKVVKKRAQLVPSVMSPIIEVNNEANMPVIYNSPKTGKKDATDNKQNLDTPLLIHRKRKLYSPKDDYVLADNVHVNPIADNVINEDDLPISEYKKGVITPKTTTCCEELETKHLKYKRIFTRKSRCKVESSNMVSPKSKKNNSVFDALKENIEINNKITTVDKEDCDKAKLIYNFTSDSEDEEFIKMKNNLQKRISATTIESENSVISIQGRRKKRTECTENDHTESADEPKKKSTAKRTRVTKRGKSKPSSGKVKVNAAIELEDETMRRAVPEELNTSLLIEKPSNSVENEDLNPAVQSPQVELVVEDDVNDKPCETIIEKKKSTRNAQIPLKKEKAGKQNALLAVDDKDNDRTISPLPELVVEMVAGMQMVTDDSFNSNMIQKINRFCQEPNAVNNTNTTQNMLSDGEITNLNIQMDLTEDIEKETSFVTENEFKKASFGIYQNENVISSPKENNDGIGKNDSLRHYESVSNPKRTYKKKKLQLKSKKEDCKSAKKEVISSEKSKIPNREDKAKCGAEIICINDDNSLTKIKSNIVAKPMATLDISEATEMKSQKPVSSDGITGHGDLISLFEDPPSLKTLKEKLTPRELVDMEESIKENYLKLLKEMMPSDDDDSDGGTLKSKGGVNVSVVSPERYNISKLLAQNAVPHKLTKEQVKKSRYDYSRWLPSQKNSDSDLIDSTKTSESGVKSPVVCLSRLPEEVLKLYSQNSSDSDLSKASKSVSIIKLPDDISEWFNDPTEKRMIDVSNYDKNPQVKVLKSKLCSPPADNSKRLSMISPINSDLFDKIVTNKRKVQSNTSEHEAVADSENAGSKNVGRTPLPTSNDSSPKSEVSSSTRIEGSRISAKTHPPEGVKRRKLVHHETRPDLVSCEDGHVVSSIDEWFQSQRSDTNMCMRDVLVQTMEKLNTTVVELEQNTTKNLLNMFASAQKRLGDMAAERHASCDQQRRLVDALSNAMELSNKRSKENERDFSEWLARELVGVKREERATLRAMKQLLLEDLQAVLNFIDSGLRS